MKNNLLPLDLQYLFQNEYLDSVKILIVLQQFKRRRKGISLEELNYYFTITELLEHNREKGYEFNQEYYQDNYLVNENVLRNYSISLKNQNLINIQVENTSKKSILYFKISDLGEELVKNLNDDYFDTIVDRFNFVNKNLKYSVQNHRKVLSRDEK